MFKELIVAFWDFNFFFKKKLIYLKVVSKKDRYRERVGTEKRERERESERKKERERSISIYWFYPRHTGRNLDQKCSRCDSN